MKYFILFQFPTWTFHLCVRHVSVQGHQMNKHKFSVSLLLMQSQSKNRKNSGKELK